MDMYNDLDHPMAGPSKRPTVPISTTFASSTSSATPALASSAYPVGPDDQDKVDLIPSRQGRKLCVRHQVTANQDLNRKLQHSLDNLPLNERSSITQLWSTFSNATHARRKVILEGILTMCCSTQLSQLSDSLNLITRLDPLSILPREVNLRILGFLDAISLGRAAQVTKSWKALADDDLLWRRMCGQHIDRKCDKCGWGLPLLERRRLKVELQDRSPSVAFGVGGHDHEHGHDHQPTMMITRTEALGGKAPEFEALQSQSTSTSSAANGHAKRSLPSENGVADGFESPMKKPKVRDGNISDGSTDGGRALTRSARLTRPWKDVYCERLVVERNWRKGRHVLKTLKGHTESVMCLQFHTTLTSPSYPVLITGSYDRTVRVWNLDTGQVVRVLHGHTRAVRTLQFDQLLLFTGAMDGTVRMWNWRSGECLRVLEGHTDGVVSLNYNGKLLATGSADSTIQIWNVRSGKKISLPGHEDWVNSVMLWDGKTSPGDLDPTTMSCFSKTRVTSPGPNASSSDKEPDFDAGQMLFSSGDDGVIKLWDLASRQCLRTFTGHKAQVQSLRVLMVDMTAEEVASATRRQAARRALTPPASDGIANGGGSNFVSGSQASLSPSPPTGTIDIPEDFDPVSIKTSDQVVPKVYLHSTDEGKVADNLYVGKKALLVTGGLDGTVRLWDVDEGTERSTLFGHIEGVWAVDMDALRLASASHDRTIKVWDRESGNCVQTLVGHRGAVNTLQLSDDMIISGSDDGDVMVWNFAPPKGALVNGPITPSLPEYVENK